MAAVLADSPLEEQVQAEVRIRFPHNSLLQIDLIPPAPDEGSPAGLTLELVPRGPEEYNQAAVQRRPRGRRGIPEAVYQSVVNDFRKTHSVALADLARDLPNLIPGATHLAIRYGGFTGAWDVVPASEPKGSTPVLARLDATDMETLDTLVSAGFASSRADAIRWALARVRERPAYAELQQRIDDLAALKAQF